MCVLSWACPGCVTASYPLATGTHSSTPTLTLIRNNQWSVPLTERECVLSCPTHCFLTDNIIIDKRVVHALRNKRNGNRKNDASTNHLICNGVLQNANNATHSINYQNISSRSLFLSCRASHIVWSVYTGCVAQRLSEEDNYHTVQEQPRCAVAMIAHFRFVTTNGLSLFSHLNHVILLLKQVSNLVT